MRFPAAAAEKPSPIPNELLLEHATALAELRALRTGTASNATIENPQKDAGGFPTLPPMEGLTPRQRADAVKLYDRQIYQQQRREVEAKKVAQIIGRHQEKI